MLNQLQTEASAPASSISSAQPSFDMADKAHISTLPMELLAHVTSYINSTDLPPLRMTCRALEAAVFDAFATEYLHCLRCLVTDPARVQRILTIISVPRLARKVRRVSLTMHVFERRRAHIAPRLHTPADIWATTTPSEQHAAYRAARAEHAREQHRIWNEEHAAFQAPVTLYAVLTNIKAGQIALSIDLAACNHYDEALRTRRSCDHVLDAVAYVCCPVAHLNRGTDDHHYAPRG
ncbi:hypothetical protein LTR08_000784 [Meristemomyces frigidus]|nr:hypothetical protein LTR08_000784 [Meristemomyces frigidus]